MVHAVQQMQRNLAVLNVSPFYTRRGQTIAQRNNWNCCKPKRYFSVLGSFPLCYNVGGKSPYVPYPGCGQRHSGHQTHQYGTGTGPTAAYIWKSTSSSLVLWRSSSASPAAPEQALMRKNIFIKQRYARLRENPAPCCTRKGEIQHFPPQVTKAQSHAGRSCRQTRGSNLWKVNWWGGSPEEGEEVARGPPARLAARCRSPRSKPWPAGLGDASLRLLPWQLVKWRCSRLSGSLEVSWGLIKWCLKTLRAPGGLHMKREAWTASTYSLRRRGLDGETDSSGNSALQVFFSAQNYLKNATFGK